MQRTKGATYEREICKVFADALGFEVKRNIGQARDGGNDITIGPLILECKRRKTLTTLEGWMEQADAAAGIDQYPIVIARADNGESYAIAKLEDFIDLIRTEVLLRMAT